jgi:hypothetical protein
MLGVTLTACGLVSATPGTWRGFANARSAIVCLAPDGDLTRAAIEASRPFLDLIRVRRFLRPVVIAMVRAAIAIHGLLMAGLGGVTA